MCDLGLPPSRVLPTPSSKQPGHREQAFQGIAQLSSFILLKPKAPLGESPELGIDAFYGMVSVSLPSDLVTLWTLVSIPGQAYTSWAQLCPKH